MPHVPLVVPIPFGYCGDFETGGGAPTREWSLPTTTLDLASQGLARPRPRRRRRAPCPSPGWTRHLVRGGAGAHVRWPVSRAGIDKGRWADRRRRGCRSRRDVARQAQRPKHLLRILVVLEAIRSVGTPARYGVASRPIGFSALRSFELARIELVQPLEEAVRQVRLRSEVRRDLRGLGARGTRGRASTAPRRARLALAPGAGGRESRHRPEDTIGRWPTGLFVSEKTVRVAPAQRLRQARSVVASGSRACRGEGRPARRLDERRPP